MPCQPGHVLICRVAANALPPQLPGEGVWLRPGGRSCVPALDTALLRTGPWLRRAIFDGGIVVPGRPSRNSFDLRLSSSHALITGPGELVLPWSSHIDFQHQHLTSEGWMVSDWNGSGSPAGAALEVHGELEDQLKVLPYMRRWSLRAQQRAWGTAAPLHRSYRFSGRTNDLDVLNALCCLLAERTDLRARLMDEATVTALLKQIFVSRHGRAPELQGSMPLTIATIEAMRALGYTHRVGGRPMPDFEAPSTEEVVSRVLDHIASNPWASQGVGQVPIATRVRSLVQRDYTRTAPWPFHALFTSLNTA